MAQVAENGAADRLGQALSLLCVLHCLLTPLLLAALPAAGLVLLADPAVHQGLAGLVVAAWAWAFVPGYLRHRRRGVVLLAAVGLGLLLGALALRERLGEAAEAVGTVAGSVLLVAAHARNRACSRACEAGEQHVGWTAPRA